MPTTSSRESISISSPLLRFSILGVISLAIWFRPLISSFALALRDDQYTHILLILPISAALIFLDWKSPEPSSRLSGRIGSVLLAIAVLVTAAVRWRAVPLSPDVRLAVNMLAFVVWWIAAFVFCFGTRAFRHSFFALCFLLWIVPLPEFVMNPIVSLLQRGSAASAHLLFAAVGIPVAQRGMLLHIPGLTLEVAPECSSIRSSLMLVVTTMVLAHLLLRSFWRKALVIAVAIPLSVAKNGLRIFVLGMLGTRVDPSFLTGRLHRQGGIIYFLIALSAIFLLLWILRHGEKEIPGLEASSHLKTIHRAKA
ncbi:MAG: exosortase/archaeosortase family protein [Candidatus Sulfotelmatobacter sp.]